MSSAKARGARATKVARQSIKTFFGTKGNKEYLTRVASELELPLGETGMEILVNIYKHIKDQRTEEKIRQMEKWIMRKIHNYRKEELRDALYSAASPRGANHDPLVTNQNTSFAFSTPAPQPLSQLLFSPNLHTHTVTGSQDLFTQDQIIAANDDEDPRDPSGNMDISQEDHED